jgi:hypothetical protein
MHALAEVDKGKATMEEFVGGMRCAAAEFLHAVVSQRDAGRTCLAEGALRNGGQCVLYTERHHRDCSDGAAHKKNKNNATPPPKRDASNRTALKFPIHIPTQAHAIAPLMAAEAELVQQIFYANPSVRRRLARASCQQRDTAGGVVAAPGGVHAHAAIPHDARHTDAVASLCWAGEGRGGAQARPGGVGQGAGAEGIRREVEAMVARLSGAESGTILGRRYDEEYKF